MEKVGYLESLQLGFKPGYGNKTLLITLVDDFWWVQETCSASILCLLDLLVAVRVTDYGTMLWWIFFSLQGQFQSMLLGNKSHDSRPFLIIMFFLMLNIYMKLLGEIMHWHRIRYHWYSRLTK